MMQRLNIQITNEQYARLQELKTEGRSMSAHIREILDSYFRKQQRYALK